LLTVSTHTTSTTKKKSRKSTKASKRGQQKIDPARAREIQEALIREHYMDGTATGTWDAKSQAAMQRYQADNGWQSKVVPDSRALIKMGLGPDHQHLLNPESAMTSQPEAPHAAPASDQSRGMETPK
jgi:peptidoglycan hydrolase-like protein with peptidoglycan-binding domain